MDEAICIGPKKGWPLRMQIVITPRTHWVLSFTEPENQTENEKEKNHDNHDWNRHHTALLIGQVNLFI